MADRKMKQMFKEAADIAKSVPAEFRETAFNRALDMLSGKDGHEFEHASEKPAARRGILGVVPDFLLDRSLDAVNFATAKLGREAVSAEEVAEILTERFGVPATRDMVIRAMMTAGQMVVTARDGGRVLYSVVRPDNTPAPPKRGAKNTATKKATPVDASPTKIIRDLIALGFFRTARTTTDVVVYLQKKGIELTARQLTPVMIRLMKDGLLGRKKSKQGDFAYYED